ncbi:Vitamin K-dependent gamma-carboxylase [Arenibacter nanhaiticus]|uniref:Vitamin K-dependent gamma-carboxylase n=1 Tax=Arenibacter nanhaiticus TaxID=558155 RepID=A0A1M6KBL2_9FLAO|nr:HTTM domain-containing protein [Arenibacter nanhaiticus]SHJ56356.1 Vitamin K-dependent gamma-carboxylase [Arenibacter nanhaiticus]
MLDRFLFRKIDNAPLIVFRVLFGILISLECYGAIVTGWVKRNLVTPQFTFSFIGFEWLQPLPGWGMYAYFLVMGTLGVFVALGYKYRFSIIAFTLMWFSVYLMQKTAYNNHYYLLVLISGMMCFFPAHRAWSMDATTNPDVRSNHMYALVKWAIVLQLFIVYTYAALAKMYGDWLDYTFIELLFKGKKDYPLVGGLLQEPFLHKIVGIAGIVFDLFIIPALLWKPSRKLAFIAAIGFHLFNSIIFQIGIFPYLALAFTVFFFEAETIRKLFLRKQLPSVVEGHIKVPAYKNMVYGLLIGYFLIQLILPVRHYFIKDNVLWTEEGHRMSWRMMLRSRHGNISYKVINHTTGNTELIDLDRYLTKSQKNRIGAYPDFIWQFAQRLKNEYAKKEQDISVYVYAKVSVNGKPYQTIIAPDTDLTKVSWSHFRHNEWILPYAQTGPPEHIIQSAEP